MDDKHIIETLRKERDHLSETLRRAEAMVTALQIVLWDFAQDELHCEANRKRGAIIAIADALEVITASIDAPPEDAAKH